MYHNKPLLHFTFHGIVRFGGISGSTALVLLELISTAIACQGRQKRVETHAEGSIFRENHRHIIDPGFCGAQVRTKEILRCEREVPNM